MDELVQISRRTGVIPRVPRGDTPIIETHLAPGQEIVNVELWPRHTDEPQRKTVDWVWQAYVATRLGVPS